MSQGVEVFLYILMRDYLPTGIVREIMKDHVFKTHGHKKIYTNKHLAAMAAEYAEDLKRGIQKPVDPAGE